jgi:hypothetical protein
MRLGEGMATLLIEHPITDFTTWRAAFERFAARRKQGGVLHDRIMQPIDDPRYVFVELDFATIEEAQRFKQFLEAQIWSTPENAPALVGHPKARVADTAPI